MIYEYFCDECQTSIEIDKSMKDDIPKTVECECGKSARRIFGASAIVPEYMKATNDATGTFADFTNLNSAFKHGTRPSGKTKVYY